MLKGILSALLVMSCWIATPAQADDFRVIVDPHVIVATQQEWFHGINSEADVQDRYVTSRRSATAMLAAGFKAARFPGGIPSDYYDWTCPYWVDTKIGMEGECPSTIDENYDDYNGGVWDFYNTGSVIETSNYSDDDLVTGPEAALLKCHGLTPPSSCSHYNVGRASTSDFWSWMTGYRGNRRASPPPGVSATDFAWVAGAPTSGLELPIPWHRTLSGFQAERMLVQTNVFGRRPDDFPWMDDSTLETIMNLPPATAFNLVPSKTPNRGAQHGARWAASIHAAGIRAHYEVGNEPEGYVMRHVEKLQLCRNAQGVPTNECSSYDLDHYQHGKIWLDMYTQQFGEHAAAIRSALPEGEEVMIFGPAASASSANRNAVAWWALEEFAEANSAMPEDMQADGLSFHYYLDGPTEWQQDEYPELAEAGEIFGEAWTFRKSLARLHLPWVLREIRFRAINRYQGRRMPLVVSEWNLGSSASEYNHSYGTALVTLDVLASFARHGIEAHQYHSLHTTGPYHTSQTSNDPLRPEGHDRGFGLLTGIWDQFGGNMSIFPQPPDTPTNTYYTMALWRHMGAHALVRPNRLPMSGGPVPNEDDVAVYVHRDTDDSLQMLVINKTDEPHFIQFELQGYMTNGPNQIYWSIDPVMAYHDGVILSENRWSLFYNGVQNPGYSSGLPSPRGATTSQGTVEVLGDQVNLEVPPYSVRLVDVKGSLVPSFIIEVRCEQLFSSYHECFALPIGGAGPFTYSWADGTQGDTWAGSCHSTSPRVTVTDRYGESVSDVGLCQFY